MLQLETSKWTGIAGKKLSAVLEDTHFTRAKGKAGAHKISDINNMHSREKAAQAKDFSLQI